MRTILGQNLIAAPVLFLQLTIVLGNMDKNNFIIVRDMRNGDWYWISRRVYSDFASKIGVIGIALYNAYASYAIEKENVFPAQKTVAKKLGISKQTIIKYNEILVKNGLIKIESGKERGINNIITLVKIQGGGVNDVDRGCQRGGQGGVNVVDTNNNKYKEKNIITTPTVLEETPPPQRGRNKEIDELISLFKSNFGLSKLDGSDKQNRQYAWLVLKKTDYNMGALTMLLRFAAQHKWWSTKLTSIKDLYYNLVKIGVEIKNYKPNIVEIRK